MSVQALTAPDDVAANNTPGSPGVFKLRFIAVRSGESRLTLDYRRPFEKDTAPSRSCSIDLIVR